MKPIAIFYHVYLSGGEHPCNPECVTGIIADQLGAIQASELGLNTSLFHIGVNGTDEDTFLVSMMAPGASVNRNGPGTAELPTQKVMQDWCKVNPGWCVLYLHTKGAIHNGNPVMSSWRRCMERACVWGWRNCVHDLHSGFDSSGAHWLTPESYPVIGLTPYWGGNFWWATSDFINTLPKIDVSLSRYEAEVWIGRGPKRPKVRDYAPHFSMAGC